MKYFMELGNAKQMIVKCQGGILKACNWKAIVPTPIEVVKMLLYLANDSEDFSGIIEEANTYIVTMRNIYELACFKISTVGLAALLKVLENNGWFGFIEGLYTLIQEQQITIDLE